MELKDIQVTPDNHKYKDGIYEELGFQERNQLLEDHNTINNYLDEKLGQGRIDWGGKYAHFLDQIGIESNSDNGWWSLAAVQPDNIEYFVEHYNSEDESFTDEYENALIRYKNLKKNGFKHNETIIRKLVEALNTL